MNTWNEDDRSTTVTMRWVMAALLAVGVVAAMLSIQGVYHWLLNPVHFVALFLAITMFASARWPPISTKIVVMVTYCFLAAWAGPHVRFVAPPTASHTFGTAAGGTAAGGMATATGGGAVR